MQYTGKLLALYNKYAQVALNTSYDELEAIVRLNQREADKMYNDWENYRQEFTWGRVLDKEGNYLDVPQRIKLCNISDEHLESLIMWTVSDYEPYVHVAMCREMAHRRENNIYVEEYL